MRSEVAKAFAVVGLCAALAGNALAEGAVAPVQPAAPSAPAAPAVTPPTETPATFTLAGEIILRLRSSIGTQTPQQWVDVLTGRVANLLGTPGITPADIVIYAPKGKAPSIYALGRRLCTVDAATVRSAGGRDPLTLATLWAGRLQQTLPLANWRPPNAPEPVIPPNPPLLVTADFTKVGGNLGTAVLRSKPVIFLYGPQLGGQTAQERADQLSARLDRAAGKVTADSTDPVRVTPAALAGATLLLGDTPVITVDQALAKAAGAGSPQFLATAWAKNIRRALKLPDPDALPTIPPAPAQNAGPQPAPAAKPVAAPAAS